MPSPVCWDLISDTLAFQVSLPAGASSLPRPRICISHFPALPKPSLCTASCFPYFPKSFSTESTVPTIQTEETEAQRGQGVCPTSQPATTTGRAESLGFPILLLSPGLPINGGGHLHHCVPYCIPLSEPHHLRWHTKFSLICFDLF